MSRCGFDKSSVCHDNWNEMVAILESCGACVLGKNLSNSMTTTYFSGNQVLCLEAR